MALEYDLELSTHMTPRQALDMLTHQMNGLTWGQDKSFLSGPSITIDASVPDGLARKVIQRGFHFDPALAVVFRFISNTNYDDFRQLMLQATILLLEHAQDSVLLFNYEIIVLQRLGGRLAFNSDYHIWDDDDWLKDGIGSPFDRRPLQSPLL